MNLIIERGRIDAPFACRRVDEGASESRVKKRKEERRVNDAIRVARRDAI